MKTRFLYWILISSTLLALPTTVTSGWFSFDEQATSPIVLWWTPFTGESGDWRTCGEETCFFTDNQTYLNDSNTKMIVFYGSSFSSVDLPLPRLPSHSWALLHEESPKNNPSFCHQDLMSLFNYTATWSRHSNFPLTLLSLNKLSDITALDYYVSIAKKGELQRRLGLAPLVYVQSSCDTPSERDAYVMELQKYIDIDSYGKCLNNKLLPRNLAEAAESMNDHEFLLLVSQYKFTIAFENAIGEDYITEKLWRPLMLGSVPIYLGSPSVQDWIPNKQSVILAWDFNSPKALADYLHALNANDSAYGELIAHKTGGSIENQRLVNAMEGRSWSSGQDISDLVSDNFVEAFECYLCKETHRHLRNEHRGHSSRPPASIDTSHFFCPPPVHPVTRIGNANNWWLEHWNQARIEAQTVHQLVLANRNYSADEYHRLVAKQLAA